MIPMTRDEKSLAEILARLGFIVKHWPYRSESDPANIIYFQMHVNRHGKRPFCIDFALPNAKIGIEVDGERWHGGALGHPAHSWQQEQRQQDKARDIELLSMGWNTIRISSRMVNQPSTSDFIQNSILNLMKV